MSVTITQVATSDTFQIWLDRTNDTINCISTMCVTVNTHANGGLTTGNGFVEGTFGSRTLVANTLRGGTVQTPGVLTISSNVAITGANLTFGTVVINTTAISIGGLSVTGGRFMSALNVDTAGTSAQLVDSFDKTLYRGADYVYTIRDLNANAHQLSRVSLVHNSGDAFLTEYAVVFSNTLIGSFTANANSTHVRVYVTPTPANTHVSGNRIIIEV